METIIGPLTPMILGCVPLSWLPEVLIISVFLQWTRESFHDHLPKEEECEERLTSNNTEYNSVSTCLSCFVVAGGYHEICLN